MTLFHPSPERQQRLKRLWSPRSIRAKLLAVFITIDVLLVLSIGSLSYFTSRNALRNEALAGIEALRAARSEQIKLWFSDRERDLQALAADPKVAIFAKAAIDSLGDGKTRRTTRATRIFRRSPPPTVTIPNWTTPEITRSTAPSTSARTTFTGSCWRSTTTRTF